MKEAYGGILNIFFIAVFLVIISSILAFIVTYTKAFRMKNAIISTVEQYEGSGCMEKGTSCYNRIVSKAREIHYNVSSNKLTCEADYTNVNDMYCIKENKNTGMRTMSYKIVTQVDFYFPILSDIFSFNIFKVSGETQQIEIPEYYND